MLQTVGSKLCTSSHLLGHHVHPTLYITTSLYSYTLYHVVQSVCVELWSDHIITYTLARHVPLSLLKVCASCLHCQTASRAGQDPKI